MPPESKKFQPQAYYKGLFMDKINQNQLKDVVAGGRASAAVGAAAGAKFCGISIFECELVIAQLPNNQGS